MEHRHDFLVIGSGVAGLSFALKAAARGTVAIVSKREAQASNTWYAQGGIASVWSDQDRFDLHVDDTLTAGDGLCHREVVELVVRGGPDRIRELIDLGCHFSREGASGNSYDLGMEGGHSRRRILHAKDSTGREIEEILLERCRAHPRIEIFEHHLAIDLILASRLGGAIRDGHDRVWGAWVLDIRGGGVRTFLASATLLATGGAGKVYLYTSNPDVATGDGVAMAFRAGAAVAGLEFFQFHPTILYHPAAKGFLISEAVRGEGGVLKTLDGRPFMERYDPRRDLAPRDIVARAIDHEMKASGAEHVLLDITHRPADFLRDRFPTIHARCLEHGIDLTREPIPVVPAAHYLCGGVVTAADGRSTLDGLYCAGEAAFTGLHGANRLASNSLLESVVYAHQAFATASAEIPQSIPAVAPWNPGAATASTEEVVVSQNWDELRRAMWNYVGIVRSDKRLARARARVRLLKEEIEEYYRSVIVSNDLIELRNITTVAELIIECASRRAESRGLHYTTDHPARDDAHWRCDIVLHKAPDGIAATLDRTPFTK
ncbi:MAG TPA: L-aspartate oxidase [Candidatus Methanoperedens sp.]|nr:L-aspartate oxidase [Candidatus Methanoperedens sp.]